MAGSWHKIIQVPGDKVHQIPTPMPCPLHHPTSIPTPMPCHTNNRLCDLSQNWWINKINKMVTHWGSFLTLHFYACFLIFWAWNTFFSPQVCLYSLRHTFYEVLAYLWWNYSPLLTYSVPQVMNAFWWSFIQHFRYFQRSSMGFRSEYWLARI